MEDKRYKLKDMSDSFKDLTKDKVLEKLSEQIFDIKKLSEVFEILEE